MEVWKDIEGYEGIYKISNYGNVYSIVSNKLKTLSTNEYGYLKVNLYKNGKLKRYFVHRLVAFAFIPNPNNYKEINHKDENKTNNHISNLEWCTREYNNNYKNKNEKVKKKVRCIELDLTFNSVSEANKYFGKKENNSCICKCIRGERKMAHGYHWEYIFSN